MVPKIKRRIRQSPCPALPLETVAKFRSWFDKLTTNGKKNLGNQLLNRLP